MARLALGQLRPQPESFGDQLGHQPRRAETEILFKAPADETHDVANRPYWVAELVCFLQMHQRHVDVSAGVLFKIRSQLVKRPRLASFLSKLIKPLVNL